MQNWSELILIRRYASLEKERQRCPRARALPKTDRARMGIIKGEARSPMQGNFFSYRRRFYRYRVNPFETKLSALIRNPYATKGSR